MHRHCNFDGCSKIAKGATDFCIKHGGRRTGDPYTCSNAACTGGRGDGPTIVQKAGVRCVTCGGDSGHQTCSNAECTGGTHGGPAIISKGGQGARCIGCGGVGYHPRALPVPAPGVAGPPKEARVLAITVDCSACRGKHTTHVPECPRRRPPKPGEQAEEKEAQTKVAAKADEEANAAFATAQCIAAGVASEDGPTAAVQRRRFNARLLTQDQLLKVRCPLPPRPPSRPLTCHLHSHATPPPP